MALTQVYKSSDRLTQTTTITTNPGYFGGILIETNGSADAVVNIYDSTDTSGTQLIPQITVTGSDHYGGVIFAKPVPFLTALRVTLSGSSAAFVAYYTDMP